MRSDERPRPVVDWESLRDEHQRQLRLAEHRRRREMAISVVKEEAVEYELSDWVLRREKLRSGMTVYRLKHQGDTQVTIMSQRELDTIRQLFEREAGDR